MQHSLSTSSLNRRQFLFGVGALTIGFRLGEVAEAATRNLPLGPYGPSAEEIDSWISIDKEGIATLYTGISEVGTGNHTAVLQIMAEELDVPFAQARLVGPDTDRTPDQFVSSGSRSVERHGVPIRQAAAEARHALLELAAGRFGVPADRLTVSEGVIHSGNAKVSYGELIGDKQFQLKITGKIKPKNPNLYKIVGTPKQRIDLPGKTTGSFTFMQDVRVPGMLHGRMVRPPSHGATVVSIDEASLAGMPGLIKIVRKADLVGVVCEREEQAIAAAQKLNVVWSDWKGLPEMNTIHQTLKDTAIYKQGIPEKSPEGVVANQGDVEQTFASAAKTLKATYESPYHLHGSIGPSCSVADVRTEGTTIWTGTQTLYGLREAVAKFLGVPNDKVHAIFVEASGCYGQNGADDVVIDAVVLSQAVGRPVRVQWSRADEMGWESYKTARVTDLHCGIDAEGKIVVWKSDAWGFSGYSRPEYHEPKHGGEPGSLVTAQLSGWTKPGLEEGFSGITLSIDPNYSIPNKKATFNYLGPASHREGPIRLRVGSMRGVGAPDNIFAIESLVDELAALANIDPVEFRLKNLKDSRAIDVVKAVTERVNWVPAVTRAPSKLNGDIATGRGIALFGNEKETHVASVFEVEVNMRSGAIRVKKVTVAHDCGLIINPNGVRSQVEGGVIQGISRALMEEVKFNNSTVTSRDWMTYPIITFPDVPEEIDIILINRPDHPATGVGEASTQAVWAGLSNAIFDATGVRLRKLPFTPQRLKDALAEKSDKSKASNHSPYKDELSYGAVSKLEGIA